MSHTAADSFSLVTTTALFLAEPIAVVEVDIFTGPRVIFPSLMQGFQVEGNFSSWH